MWRTNEGLCAWTWVIRAVGILGVSFQSLFCVHMSMECVFHIPEITPCACSVLYPFPTHHARALDSTGRRTELARDPRTWIPVVRGRCTLRKISRGIWSCWCFWLLVKGEKRGEPTDPASPLPFRFPDAAGPWMLLFHVLPGIEPPDSFLRNNGCFDEFLLLPGSVPHNAIFSFPFV